MLQSDYLKSDHTAEAVGYSIEAVRPTPAHTHPTIQKGHAEMVQTDLIAADLVESTTTLIRKTGIVFRGDQSQTAFTTKVPAITKLADGGTMGNDADENTLIQQSTNNNEPRIPPMDDLTLENPNTGESAEESTEPSTRIEPVRLTAPVYEAEADSWPENDIREDPVPFIWPAEEKWLSGYNYSSGHPGIDIAAMHEDLIFAAASGIVVQVQRSYYGYGNMLIIDHLNGYQTLYAHLNSILAELDDFVIQGQPIGLAGSTGYSTGTHLHFEIHYEGRCVNPWHFLTR